MSRRTPSWALSRRCSVVLASDQADLPRDMNSLSVDCNVVWGKGEKNKAQFQEAKVLAEAKCSCQVRVATCVSMQ